MPDQFPRNKSIIVDMRKKNRPPEFRVGWGSVKSDLLSSGRLPGALRLQERIPEISSSSLFTL